MQGRGPLTYANCELLEEPAEKVPEYQPKQNNILLLIDCKKHMALSEEGDEGEQAEAFMDDAKAS